MKQAGVAVRITGKHLLYLGVRAIVVKEITVMYELEIFDAGLSACTMDVESCPAVGDVIVDEYGIEMKIIAIITIDKECQMAQVEIEYL